MADTMICTNIEVYFKTTCPYCEGRNWVCDGDPSDLTYPYLDGVECRICGKRYWLGDPLDANQKIEDAMCSRGKTVDEL